MSNKNTSFKTPKVNVINQNIKEIVNNLITVWSNYNNEKDKEICK